MRDNIHSNHIRAPEDKNTAGFKEWGVVSPLVWEWKYGGKPTRTFQNEEAISSGQH